jgi:hypothetical protein
VMLGVGSDMGMEHAHGGVVFCPWIVMGGCARVLDNSFVNRGTWLSYERTVLRIEYIFSSIAGQIRRREIIEV